MKITLKILATILAISLSGFLSFLALANIEHDYGFGFSSIEKFFAVLYLCISVSSIITIGYFLFRRSLYAKGISVRAWFVLIFSLSWILLCFYPVIFDKDLNANLFSGSVHVLTYKHQIRLYSNPSISPANLPVQ